MRRIPFLMPASLLLLMGCPASPDDDGDARVEGAEAGDCSDAADNDQDGTFDCDDDGCAGSPDCSAENAAPSGLTIAIDPASPDDDDDLACIVVTDAIDPNGDAVTYRYAWTVDGADAAVDGANVAAAVTTPGQSWTCTVTPTDGALDGSPVAATVTIQAGNQPPIAPLVSITPASPTDDDVLNCVIDAESVDPEGSPVTYAYAWSVDGVDAGVSTASVGAAQTTVGEAWTCHVTASDGLLEVVGESDSVTIDAACSTGEVTLSASGINFVRVCAQTFDMGCTAGQSDCNADESPVMPVTLTNDYYVSSTEITQGQYRSLMGTNPSNFLACGDDCPVERVTWHMAAAFANAVSQEAGLEECYACIGSGSATNCTVARDPYACGGYRLLTEAEWEGAARCGEDLLYAGSNVLDDVAWYASNSASTSWAVALKDANACGVYDMSGNVSEWTQDLYSDSFYTSSGRTDPTGARSGTYSVLRGGNLANSQNEQRVSFRSAYLPSFVNYNIGLRLARTAP